MKKTRTFTVTYNYFKPGTVVEPVSTRSPLSPGKYRVLECHDPVCAGDECIAIVEGHQYGVNAAYLKEVEH